MVFVVSKIVSVALFHPLNVIALRGLLGLLLRSGRGWRRSSAVLGSSYIGLTKSLVPEALSSI